MLNSIFGLYTWIPSPKAPSGSLNPVRVSPLGTLWCFQGRVWAAQSHGNRHCGSLSSLIASLEKKPPWNTFILDPLSLGGEVEKSERDWGKWFLTIPPLNTSCDGRFVTSHGSLCRISKLEFLENSFRCQPQTVPPSPSLCSWLCLLALHRVYPPLRIFHSFCIYQKLIPETCGHGGRRPRVMAAM